MYPWNGRAGRDRPAAAHYAVWIRVRVNIIEAIEERLSGRS
jgi:hypothetical protein